MMKGQREKIQNGQTGDKKFENEGGRECNISREGARLYSGGIHVGGVRRESHSATSGDTAREAAPGMRAVKSSEFGGKVVSTFDGPIWSRCSIALTCPARSHFQRTLSKERWGLGWDEC